MRKRALLCAFLMLAGCAQVPRQGSYPLTYQPLMQSSEHWNDLAGTIAEEVTQTISPSDIVFISDADGSPFGRALRTLLVTQLRKRDVKTTVANSGNVEIAWDIENVSWNGNRSNYSGHGIFVAVADIIQYVIFGGNDVTNVKPKNEIIITYNVIRHDNDRTANVIQKNYRFYINGVDSDNYWYSVSTKKYDRQPLVATYNYILTNN